MTMLLIGVVSEWEAGSEWVRFAPITAPATRFLSYHGRLEDAVDGDDPAGEVSAQWVSRDYEQEEVDAADAQWQAAEVRAYNARETRETDETLVDLYGGVDGVVMMLVQAVGRNERTYWPADEMMPAGVFGGLWSHGMRVERDRVDGGYQIYARNQAAQDKAEEIAFSGMDFAPPAPINPTAEVYVTAPLGIDAEGVHWVFGFNSREQATQWFWDHGYNTGNPDWCSKAWVKREVKAGRTVVEDMTHWSPDAPLSPYAQTMALADRYMAEGMSDLDAIGRALAEMGSSVSAPAVDDDADEPVECADDPVDGGSVNQTPPDALTAREGAILAQLDEVSKAAFYSDVRALWVKDGDEGLNEARWFVVEMWEQDLAAERELALAA